MHASREHYADVTLIDVRGALDWLPALPLNPSRHSADRLAATGTDGKSDTDARFTVYHGVFCPADILVHTGRR